MKRYARPWLKGLDVGRELAAYRIVRESARECAHLLAVDVLGARTARAVCEERELRNDVPIIEARERGCRKAGVLEPIPLVAMVVHAVYWHRAVGGSTWSAFFAAQVHPWFVQAMVWRNVFGFVMAFGLALLFWDVLTIGRGERRVAAFAPPRVDAILSTGL